MGERRTRGRVELVELLCPLCGEVMTDADQVKLCNPPLYGHACPSGHLSYTHRQYPYQDFIPEEGAP